VSETWYALRTCVFKALGRSGPGVVGAKMGCIRASLFIHGMLFAGTHVLGDRHPQAG
jgi:hypothetical protein